MTEQKLVPKKRFRTFKDVWNENKLGNMGVFTKGKGYSKKDIKPSGVQLILYGRLYTNYETVIKKVDTYTRDKENSVISKGNEVIIPSSGETKEDIVRASVIANPGIIIGGDLNIINVFDYIDPIFMSLNISNSSQRKEIMKNVQGSSVVHLYNDDLKKINVVYPELIEQQKIGEFFNVLDERIANQERKIAKVKALKDAYLTEMFPQEGETVPKRRFKGFEEEWEKTQLGDVVNITMGHSPKSSCYTNDSTNHILVQGNADIERSRVVPRVWTTQVTKTANKNDLIMTVRAPVGEVGKTDYNVVLGRGVCGLEGNEFIFQYLIKLKSEGFWTKLSTGSTFDSVNSNDIKEVSLLLPNEMEQQKIGQFLKNLDDQISAEETKLEKLKKMKEAYLEEMFV